MKLDSVCRGFFEIRFLIFDSHSVCCEGSFQKMDFIYNFTWKLLTLVKQIKTNDVHH